MNIPKIERYTYQAAVDSLLKGMADTLIRKNNDYSRHDDAFVNFRSGENWGVDVLKSIRLRLGDKIQRIDTFLSGTQLEVESVEDSYRDVIGYCVLSIIALQNGKDESPCCLAESAGNDS